MLRFQNGLISKKFYFFLFLYILNNNSILSQNHVNTQDLALKARDSINGLYSLDPLLYNGMIYDPMYLGNIFGDQYFINSNYLKGEITIRGVKFKNLELNFDIYKHQLLLKYLNSNNALNIIVISKAWLEDFSIENTRFILYSTPEKPDCIYQTLGNESIKLFYYLEKNLVFDDNTNNLSYKFIIKKEQFVLINKSLKKFHNNRSFVQIFNKEKQTFINKYLKQNKIKVKHSSDQAMELLINYCSKL